MPINVEAYRQLVSELKPKNVTLVAVSKTKPVEEIRELFNVGQRDFGENYVQELVDKQQVLSNEIRWHFIGHLQTNKVKYIAPFVHLIHSVDSFKLLKEINKQAIKQNRVIDVLLQMHVAQEETKFGLDENELKELMQTGDSQVELSDLKNIRIRGLMGMASLTENEQKIRAEFQLLKKTFDKYAQVELPNCQFEILSMGMTGDYKTAVEEGSTLVRIGSMLFGARI